MGKPISADLRQRVCDAVSEGLPAVRRQHGFKSVRPARFAGSAGSATHVSFAASPQGGDQKSGRIEAQATFILDQVAQRPDITLAELQALRSARGLDVGIGTMWRFFNRRQISF